MSRPRWQLLGKRKPKPKAGSNAHVLDMTKGFLKKEKEEATKPLGKNAKIDLTSDEALNLMIDLSEGGGKSKKKKKKHSPPRKRASEKPKRKKHIPFGRTPKLMEQDPVSEFYIPGPIPSFEEQQKNEESLHQYIDQERQNRKAEAEAEYEHLRQEAMRQFKEEAMREYKQAAAEKLDFIPIAKGKKAQKKKGGRRKTRKKKGGRRTRRKTRKKHKKRRRRKKKTKRRRKR